MSLVSVICRAGLSIEVALLKKNLKMVLLLGSLPVLVEAFSLAYLGLWAFGLPWSWLFMMAFGVASISPGVVVPLILNLLEIPSWTQSRLPPLMLAATGLDVLIATTSFGIAFSSAFPHFHTHSDSVLLDSWIWLGLEEILGGLFLGVLLGSLAFLLKKLNVQAIFSLFFMFLTSIIVMGWVCFFMFFL
jgi:hypothetical protein